MYIVLPVLLLQCYVGVYTFLIMSYTSRPVDLSLLYYSGAIRALICGSLENANCTLTYNRADRSSNVHFTPHRPDAVLCAGEASVAGYESRYSACTAALIGDDLIFRALCGITASTTAIMTLISVELLQLIPVGVDNLLHPKHFCRRYCETGISWPVQLAVLILYFEPLCCAANLVLFGWVGIGQTLLDYLNGFLMLFLLPKVLVATLLLTEFMRRRYATGIDAHTLCTCIETLRSWWPPRCSTSSCGEGTKLDVETHTGGELGILQGGPERGTRHRKEDQPTRSLLL
jgi:hypothetical protein